MTKLLFAFRKFANMPKIYCIILNIKNITSEKIGIYKIFHMKLTFLAFTSAKVFTNSKKWTFSAKIFQIESKVGERKLLDT